MGITYHEAKRLWEAHLSGVSFDNVLTVSRQQLFLHPTELESLRRARLSVSPPPAAAPLANYQFGEYVDRFCQEFLGSTTVTSIDYSAYEGAAITHDLNRPVPETLRGRFDAVIEAGTLEHIFNFPVAIANLMQMTKVGGSVFLTTVANNLCGHGFYQFSPELMYRIFSPENGFESTRIVFLEAAFPWVELVPIRGTYNVVDPVTVGSRVGLLSKRPVMMMVDSKKVTDTPLFATSPLQSDYVTEWGRGETAPAEKAIGLLRRIIKQVPASWKRRFNGHRYNRLYSLSNRRFYHKLS